MNILLAVLCLSASLAAVSADYGTCAPPVKSKNLEVTPELQWYEPEYNLGVIITISCKKYYLYDVILQIYIRGNSLKFKCAGNNKYAPPLPAGKYICKEREPTCSLSVKLPLIADPANKNIFTRGESVTFKCDDGYYLSGVSKLRCGKNGKWDNNIPICLPYCKKPRQKYLIVNDEDDSYMSGGSITLECEDKYRLTGDVRRYCESDGKWDPEIEDNLCKRTGCPPPGPIKKGSYSPGPGKDNWYEESEKITYKCVDNYYLEGKSRRTCSRKGVFIYGEPKCIEIRCDKPMDIEKGDYGPKEDDYAVDDSVTYKCIENYRLSTKSGKRFCRKKGDKTAEFDSAPSCIRIECDKPQTIKYGIYLPKRTNHYVGDTVKYKCDAGFYLFGDAEIECLLNKDRLTADYETAPECRPIECDKPMAPNKGSFKPVKSKYRLEETIDFDCITNYYLDGPSSATCVEDTRTKGKFTKIPLCVEVRCDKPMVPRNGKITPSEDDYPVGDEITYSCDKYFRLEPKDGDRTCTLNPDKKTATFGPGARCEEILCDEPMNIENGDFVTEPEGPYRVETVVRYKCNRGYKFSTKFTTSTCELQRDRRSAKFSKRPSCERVYCDNPGKPDKGDITKDKTQYVVDETVTWSCDSCYKLEGSKTATCQQNGQFDNSVPTCEIRQCDKNNVFIPRFAIFSPIKKYYDCGERITYRCVSNNYQLSGSSKSECLPDGTFTDAKDTRCNLIKCRRPKLNKNVRITPDKEEYVVETEITYSCKGYNKPDTDKLTAVCQRDGTFSRGSPNCIPIKCGKPPLPDKGSIIDYDSSKTEYNPYEGVEYECDRYYSLDGKDTNVCEPSGEWKNSAPTCKPPVCKNSCHLGEVYGRPCQCNPGCMKKGNCCKDYVKECYERSCKNRCGKAVPGGCSCIPGCTKDPRIPCCKDFLTECAWYEI